MTMSKSSQDNGAEKQPSIVTSNGPIKNPYIPSSDELKMNGV